MRSAAAYKQKQIESDKKRARLGQFETRFLKRFQVFLFFSSDIIQDRNVRSEKQNSTVIDTRCNADFNHFLAHNKCKEVFIQTN